MGGPDMAPHSPHILGAPRGTRGTPRSYARFGGPDMAPHSPNVRPVEPGAPL